MGEKINATEAARGFSDLINRTRYRRESFTVVRNGEEVCLMVPPNQKVTFREVIQILRQCTKPDPEFAIDIAQLQSEQPRLPENPWDS